MSLDREHVALVVDDEDSVRLFAAQILADEDFILLEATNAAKAMEQLRENEDVSVVVTDSAMPGTSDGVALASHIRRARARLPLIIASGRPPPPDLPDAAKPLSGDALHLGRFDESDFGVDWQISAASIYRLRTAKDRRELQVTDDFTSSPKSLV